MTMQPIFLDAEAGHAELVPVAAVEITSASATEIGLETVATIGTRPVEVRVELELQNLLASAAFLYVRVLEDDVEVVEWRTPTMTLLFEFSTFCRSKRLTPTEGDHTYTVDVRLNNASGRQIDIPQDSVNNLWIIGR